MKIVFLKRENINNTQWKTQEKNKYVNNTSKEKLKCVYKQRKKKGENVCY